MTGAAPLSGLRVVEISAFVAAPLGGMTLAQLGAEVIRIDPLGGNIDAGRWPHAPDGTSLYWSSLNKGKKSVTLALDTPEGQALARDLVCSGGSEGGILLTNLPSRGWMTYEALAEHRPDLIMARLTGHHDGRAALDYTVNCAGGLPAITGEGGAPVNHVLPVWDVASGLYLALGLLAAERTRRLEGRGQLITLALADVMLATLGNLGYLADQQVNGSTRKAIGNYVYGAYGRDFETADGRRVMVVAISNRQWRALAEATGLAARLDLIGPMMEVDMASEGGRFEARDAISAVLAPWFAARTLAEIGDAFRGTGVLWGPYQDFAQLLAEDPDCSLANPLFDEIDQPGAGRLLAPRIPLSFAAGETPRSAPAPRIGEDTRRVLTEMIGLSPRRLDELAERRIISVGAGKGT